jgi:hypothetical protein
MVKKGKQKLAKDASNKPEYEPSPIPGDKTPDDLASERDHPNPNRK